MWVISIQIYLIYIFVVKGSRPSKDSKVTGQRDKWDLLLHLEWGYISVRSKMTKYILNCIFPCDGVEYWYQEWLWWLGSIDRCLGVQLAESMPKWRIASSRCPKKIQRNHGLVNIMPADELTPLSVATSAGLVMTKFWSCIHVFTAPVLWKLNKPYTRICGICTSELTGYVGIYYHVVCRLASCFTRGCVASAPICSPARSRNVAYLW